jgi:hypothetical protein
MNKGAKALEKWIGKAKDPAARAVQVLKTVMQETSKFEHDHKIDGLGAAFAEAMRFALGEL